MGSHFGKIIYYKTLKSQEDEENGVVSDASNSDEQGGTESRKITGEIPTWKAIANMTSFVQGVGALALPYAVLKGGIATIIGFPLFALIHWYTGTVMVDCMYDDVEEEEEEKEEKEKKNDKDEEKISKESLLRTDNNKQIRPSTKLRVVTYIATLGKFCGHNMVMSYLICFKA